MFAKLFARRRRDTSASCGWAVARSSGGDVLLSVAEGALSGMTTPVLIEGADGSLCLTDSKSGRKALLVHRDELSMLDGAFSVVLATVVRGTLSLRVAPVIRKGRKPTFSFGRGKVYTVTVDRVADDGRETGAWRGFVSLHAGLTDIFVEISPAFPISVGARLRVVGVLEPVIRGSSGMPGMRFKPGAWVPLSDRGAIFTAAEAVHVADSMDEGGRAAQVVATQALLEMSRLHQYEAGTKVPLPPIHVSFGDRPTTAQVGLRSRLRRINNVIFRPGKPKGRRIRLRSTEWHGAVRQNGDLLIEVRRPKFDEQPTSAAVLLSRDWLTTADGKATRIGVRYTFARGDTVTYVLGGGPQDIATEIARRKTVLIVQGMPGTESYAEIQVTVAGVVKR